MQLNQLRSCSRHHRRDRVPHGSAPPRCSVSRAPHQQVEVVRIPARGTRRQTAVILPGNPGVAQYYQDFAASLSESLDDTDVIVFGLAGHYLDERLSESGATYVLHEQIDALDSAVQDLSASGPLVLVGHSIGAHIALQLARRRAVHAVIGLYPFMRVNKRSHMQQVLGILIAIRPLVELLALLAGLLSRLPSPMRHFLLSPAFSLFGLSKDARSVTSRWLRASSIRNVCVLGASEFDALQETPDWGADCGFPVLMYYGPNDDMWAPAHDADDAAAAGVHVTRDASYGHMFCVTPEGSQHVAARTAKLIKLAALRASASALETTAQ